MLGMLGACNRRGKWTTIPYYVLSSTAFALFPLKITDGCHHVAMYFIKDTAVTKYDDSSILKSNMYLKGQWQGKQIESSIDRVLHEL